MNYRQKTNRTKRQNGTRSRNRFMYPMKKERGKHNRKKYAVKVHSVSSTDFVLSTSFAKYRIPRSFSKWFQNASQKEIQNVVCFARSPSRFESGVIISVFYWYDLDTIFDTDDFKQFEIIEE